jgi:drug/metabolite transporter (DMT)-like permease
VKYLSPLRLSGLNGVVILNGVSGGTRSAVFFSVLLLGETLTPARWLGAAMVLSSAMLAEFVHPRK